MKKPAKKLSLNKTTVHLLDRRALSLARGGVHVDAGDGGGGGYPDGNHAGWYQVGSVGYCGIVVDSGEVRVAV